MMKLNLIKHIKTVAFAAVFAGAALLAPSCTNAIYDDEGDCAVTYRIKFRYDRNLKWADAFASEVHSVRLYAFDNNGNLVAEYADRGDHLADPDYSMLLDLPAGEYHFVAWCGLDNPQAKVQNFVVPQTSLRSTTLDDLTCRLNRYTDQYKAHSNDWLEFMFHGQLDAVLPENLDGGDYLYVMPLTKDTNHIRIILQHLNGEDLDVSKFGFTIEDDNGFYANDNSLLDDDMITYTPYSTSSAVAGIIKEDGSSAAGSRAVETCKTAIADFSVARMMSSHTDRMRLNITYFDNQTGETRKIASVPVIDYALLARDYYEMYYGHPMADNREFLDREDEYLLTFFIDENYYWYNAVIYINSWRIVLHDVDLGA